MYARLLPRTHQCAPAVTRRTAVLCYLYCTARWDEKATQPSFDSLLRV